jgi:hypothetical protein
MKSIITAMLTASAFLLFIACGNGNQTTTDSLAMPTEGGGTIQQDTVPGAQMPPGAINPGEDSSRYGTGAQDSSKNRP